MTNLGLNSDYEVIWMVDVNAWIVLCLNDQIKLNSELFYV